MGMRAEEIKRERDYHKAIQKGMEVGIDKCISLAEEYIGCSANDLIKALYQLRDKGV